MSESGKQRVGFIGLGGMGSRMATNMFSAGYPLTVYNRSRSAMNPLVQRGATAAQNPREVAARSEVVITMVSDPDAVRAITAGPDGLFAGARDGLVWIDMSTVGPSDARRAATDAASHGIQLINAPVLGSLDPAEKGELVILAGGDQGLVRRYESLLRTMGKSVTYLGPNERACAAKLALNLNMAVSLQVLGESIALATRWGIPREQAVDLIGNSGVVSAAAKGRLGTLYNRAAPASFPLRLARKDLGLATAEGYDVGASLPLVATALETYTMALGAHGEEDMALIAAFVDEMSRPPDVSHPS